MKKQIITYGLLFLFAVQLMQSCKNEVNLEIPKLDVQIVVDGWIENGGYPNVILTTTSDYFSRVDSAELRSLVLTRAKVTVSDSTQSEILTLKLNNDYFPPYIYQGDELKGVAGKTYYLKVEYGGKIVTSQTTIPSPIELDSVWYELTAGSDTSGVIKGAFYDNGATKDYYKTFCKILGKNIRYIPTLVSNFDDKYFNGKRFVFSLNRGQDTYLHPTSNIYFTVGDTILLKACTLDRESFKFWQSYQDEVVNAGNPFASSHKEVLSNINGGLGIWAGYGTTIYTVIAQPKK